MRTPALLLPLLLTACAALPDPEPRFAALEARMLAAEHVSLQFTIRAEGAVPCTFEGTLTLDGDQVHLEAMGTFKNDPLTLTLRTDGDTLHLRRTVAGAAHHDQTPRPVALREGLLLVLTRMGLLHDLAMMTGGNFPDFTDGTVRDALQVGAFARAGSEDHFELTFNGLKVADIQLRYGSHDLPARRRQQVAFPAGTMTVDERYSSFIVR